MDDQRIGAALRAVRIRKRLRQSDLVTLAAVPREDVGLVERGLLSDVSWGRVKAVAAALGADVRTAVQWQGADLDRLVNAGHAAMHEVIGRFVAALPGWESLSEVTFSIYGERGAIDILAWHAASGSLLIVELKTALGDPQELVGTMDRRVRLGRRSRRSAAGTRRPSAHGWSSPSRARTGGTSRRTRRCCGVGSPPMATWSVPGWRRPRGR